MNAIIDGDALSASAAFKSALRDFVASGSTEVTPHDEPRIDAFAREIPAGYRVYVAHPPKASLDGVVRVALRLRTLGLVPSPHIVARRVPDAASLRRALDTLVAHDIRQILLIAGDRAQPEGPFSDTLRILESGVTIATGIERIGVAGHPEGHPSVDDEVLWQSLARKQAFANDTGTRVHITTQFGFDSRSLGEWEAALTLRGIGLPIHAGVAGPTPLGRLLKYALQCGVGASLKNVSANPLSFSRLPHLVTKADEMLIGVFRAKQRNVLSRIFAPHFFAFGGLLETARWLRAMVAGSFELDSATRGFVINT